MSAASSVPHGLPDEQLTVGSETWKLGRLLGRGGFASVYECVASGSGVRAAVKVIDLSQQSQWAQSKLRSEGDNLRRAQRHENIIELIGEARIGHLHLFVTERFGRDLLESVLEQRGLGEAYSRQVMVQVMRALAWLHEKRICHGDVKPENLLCERVDGVDIVKLADFGSAVQLPESGVAAVDPVAQGTTLYSPPEVLHGQAYTTGADQWAAGITTYVLITGYFPFGCTQDALTSSASFDGDGWLTVSLRAREFIQELLLHDVSARPTAEEAMDHPWLRELAREMPPESPLRAMPTGGAQHDASLQPPLLPRRKRTPTPEVPPPPPPLPNGQLPGSKRRVEVSTPTGGEEGEDACEGSTSVSTPTPTHAERAGGPPPPPIAKQRTPLKRKAHAASFGVADSDSEKPPRLLCGSEASASRSREPSCSPVRGLPVGGSASAAVLRPAKKRLRRDAPSADDGASAATAGSGTGSKPISPRSANSEGRPPAATYASSTATVSVGSAAEGSVCASEAAGRHSATTCGGDEADSLLSPTPSTSMLLRAADASPTWPPFVQMGTD